MAGPAHPEAMAPPKPGRTRTAPPQMPSTWWKTSRIRTYLLFDATGFVYFLIAFLAISLIGDLAASSSANTQPWDAAMARLQNPLYIAFHLLCLVSVIFVAVRFFRLFPKAQPPSIGPISLTATEFCWPPVCRRRRSMPILEPCSMPARPPTS